MSILVTLVVGLASGFIGWLLTEFLAKPFRRGLDLLNDARASYFIFANVFARSKFLDGDAISTVVDISEAEEKRLGRAEDTYREIGARLKAFSKTEALASPLLKIFGFNLDEAGTAFIGLSNNVGRYGALRDNSVKHVKKVLKICD